MEEAERLQRTHPPAPELDTRSWCALQLWGQQSWLAHSDEPVLLLGEVGTEKTRLARNLHRLSAKSGGLFISYSCSAIPHNLEEATLFGVVVGGFIPSVKEKKEWLTLAAGGTLFLDELADMPLLAQAKMLDAFDPTELSVVPVGATRRVPTTCRLASATNRDVFSIANQGHECHLPEGGSWVRVASSSRLRRHPQPQIRSLFSDAPGDWKHRTAG